MATNSEVSVAVCAIMLTGDRPEMAKRAIECFRRQTHQDKRLLIYDTGDPFMELITCDGIEHRVNECYRGTTIGNLRNAALQLSESEIIIHWDDDDWSAPDRIASQVQQLQESGADCVGYRDCLFWDSRFERTYYDADGIKHQTSNDAAWHYHCDGNVNLIGSSMCYWRSTWERVKFADEPKNKDASSEYAHWKFRCKTRGFDQPADNPMLICSIHGRNTSRYAVENHPENWKREPAWDDRLRAIMSL